MARSEWQLIGGRWRRRKTWIDRRIPGNYKPPPTCARCGAPVPAGTARCAETCQPRVSKQSKGKDGTDG